ncbi:MAG: glycosyltransferase family 39 protein [Acidobacteriota bacterium]
MSQRIRKRARRKPPDLRIAAGITLLAWIQRLIFLRSNRDFAWPYSFFYEGDSEVFYSYARDLLAGRLYDHGIPFHPPGFAWFLAFLHSLLGAGSASAQVPHVAVKSVMALLGSLALGLLYLLARPYLGRTVALLGAFLGVFHFGLDVLSIAPVTESFYLVLLLLALLVWTRRFEHPLAVPEEERKPGGPGWSIVLGLLLGALALTRAEAALVAVLLVGIGLLGSRWKWTGLRPWVLVALGWIAIVTPWTIRNAVRLNAVNEEFQGQTSEPLPTFVPLTLYGPINLALANNPMAKGGFSRDFMTSQAQNPGLDLKDPQHVEFILHGDRMAWTWIRGNPGAFASLVLKKWALVAEAWKLGWTQFDWPGGLNGHRRPVDMFVPDSNTGYWIAGPLSLLGLILCLATPGPARRWTGVALVVTVSVLVATGLFFGYVRLGLLIFLFWLPFLGAALAWLANLKNDRSPSLPSPADPPRRLWQTLATLAVLLLAVELWGVSLHRNFKATGVNVPGRSYLDRDAEIRFELLP